MVAVDNMEADKGVAFVNIEFDSDKKMPEVIKLIESQGVYIQMLPGRTELHGFLSKGGGDDYCLSLYTRPLEIEIGDEKVGYTPLSKQKMLELEEFINDQI